MKDENNGYCRNCGRAFWVNPLLLYPSQLPLLVRKVLCSVLSVGLFGTESCAHRGGNVRCQMRRYHWLGMWVPKMAAEALPV